MVDLRTLTRALVAVAALSFLLPLCSTTVAGHWHAFVWSDRAGMQDLGTLGGSWSLARAISEMGHVVGTSEDAQGRTRAFLWTPSWGMVDLGPGEAVALNSFDHVVGHVRDAGGVRAFLWTPKDGRIELAADAKAVDVSQTLGSAVTEVSVVGATHVSGEARTVLWRIAITDMDWVTYRRGMIDAHVAWGSLPPQYAPILRAWLTEAERALRQGDQAGAQYAIEQFVLGFSHWREVDELPWA